MRKRASKLTVIGAAIGLVLGGAAIAPANAAPVPTSLTATSCSAFKGLTVTGATAGFSGVALKGGDTITTTVSPAGAGDSIGLSGSLGLNIIIAEGPTFRAPADGYYNLTWSLKTTSTASTSRTWSFDATCSTSTISPTPTTPTKPGKGNGKNR